MSVARQHWAGLVALLCIAVTVVLALLAVDVRAVRTTVERDDVQFRARPTHASLWHLQGVLPGNPAAGLIGASDTTAYRHALQFFWYSRIGANPQVHEDMPTIRAEAQQRLQDEMESAWSRHERSAAANLLGVLVVTTPAPASDRPLIRRILKRGAAYFQHAITLDPTNDDAKQNLELVLRVASPKKGGLNHDARSGYGSGSGHAIVPTGSGY